MVRYLGVQLLYLEGPACLREHLPPAWLNHSLYAQKHALYGKLRVFAPRVNLPRRFPYAFAPPLCETYLPLDCHCNPGLNGQYPRCEVSACWHPSLWGRARYSVSDREVCWYGRPSLCGTHGVYTRCLTGKGRGLSRPARPPSPPRRRTARRPPPGRGAARSAVSQTPPRPRRRPAAPRGRRTRRWYLRETECDLKLQSLGSHAVRWWSRGQRGGMLS